MAVRAGNGEVLRRPIHIKPQPGQQGVKAAVADNAAFQTDASRQFRWQDFLPLPDDGLWGPRPSFHRIFFQLYLGKFITGQTVKSVIFLYGTLKSLPHRLRFVLGAVDSHLFKIVELGRVSPPWQLRLEMIPSLWRKLGQRFTLEPSEKGG